MSTSVNTSPFAGTAPYYQRFRAPYAQAAIDFIVKRFELHRSAHVLDLGCGPGTIAIPLSHSVAEVVAVDPDPEMIAEGRRLATLQGRQNIQWVESKAENLALKSERFLAAVIGQAFHWMDRDEMLKILANLVADHGGLALVNPGRRRPQESWEPTAKQVVAEFLGSPIRHPQANPHEPAHEPALLRSEYFSQFTAFEFPSTFRRDIASIVGCIYSTSTSTKAMFGDDAGKFEAALSRELLNLNPEGVFNEHIETEVIIALKRRQ